MNEQRTSEPASPERNQWVYLTLYPRVPTSYRYKTLAEDWDKMTEEQRQEELTDAAMEFCWLPEFDYEETGRGSE
jgi:hypothetical protein